MAVVLPVSQVGLVGTQMPSMAVNAPAASGFGEILTSGLAAVDARVAKADALVAAFARGDTVPIHQVMMALEQARLSVQLAAEVRTRLLEAYRDFMTMQL